jgi:hypothetical protein
MLGASKFFGVKFRRKVPLALDVTFSVDCSVSMPSYWRFIRSTDMLLVLEDSLRKYGVGNSLPNRYSQVLYDEGAIFLVSNPPVGETWEQRMNIKGAQRRWMEGPDINFEWNQAFNFTNIDTATEDMTGQAWWILDNIELRNERPLDPLVEQIIISASDEQRSTPITRAEELETLLNASDVPLRRIIGLCGIRTVVNESLAGGADPKPAGDPVGCIFNNRDNYIIPYSTGSGSFVTHKFRFNVPPRAVTFRDSAEAGVVHTTTSDLVFERNVDARINYVRLANATFSPYLNTGAIFDLDRVSNNQQRIDMMARVIADMLGDLIYPITS